VILIWLEGSTPHVNSGIRIEGSIEWLADQLKGDDGWIVVNLVDGGKLNIRSGRIIAFQESDE
jgi:hypothetical protein